MESDTEHVERGDLPDYFFDERGELKPYLLFANSKGFGTLLPAAGGGFDRVYLVCNSENGRAVRPEDALSRAVEP